MPIDFSKIEDKVVGYLLKQPKGYIGMVDIEPLIFKDFITFYSIDENNIEKVIENLNKGLEARMQQQESLTRLRNSKTRSPVEVVALLALEREVILNSINLIKDNYLK